MNHKVRITDGRRYNGTYSYGYIGSVTSSQAILLDTDYKTEVLSSQNHPWPPTRNKSKKERTLIRLYGKKDLGGPFSVQRSAVYASPAYVSNASTDSSHKNLWWDYSGPLWHENTPSGLPLVSNVPPLILNSTLLAKGTIGWNRYKPTHKQVDVFTAVGELRALGGLPINPKMIHELREVGRFFLHPLQVARHISHNLDQARLIHRAGSGYLAYQFGIAPYVRDIQDLVRKVVDFDKNLKQLARDNGRHVRRKGRVSLDTTSVTISNGGGIPGRRFRPLVATQMWNGLTVSHVTTETSQEYWFSGQFRYWLDPTHFGGKGIPGREMFQLQRILYGIDPSDVTTIWKLMPWSWLIDWLVPIGPMIDNLVNDQQDNLTADYAYIMGRSTNNQRSVVSGTFTGIPVQASVVIVNETKQRIAASPYGFGLSFTGFNLKQLAILAALGVSRG